MKNVTFLIIILFSSLCTAQYVITIEANIIDSNTRLGIPYVNAGFVDKAIGTVTNKDGFMSLQFDESKIADDDIIQFSGIGYKTQNYSFKELADKFQTGNIITLIKDIYEFEEVLVTSKWGEKFRIGSKGRTNESTVYWKDRDALGGEIASFVRVPKGKHRISEVAFNVVENSSDSLKVRINFYNYSKGYPKGQLLTKPIYHTISSKNGIEVIDLTMANVIVSEDVVVSIELVEVYGEELGLAISQSLNSKQFFLRKVSQDGWRQQISNGVDLSVVVESLLQDELGNHVLESKVNSVSILWDVSRSMKDRSLEKEITLLKEYLSNTNPSKVDVTLFSNTINNNRSFNYSSAQEDLYSFLENQSYLGNTDTSDLTSLVHNADVTFLFSDGNFNSGNSQPPYISGDCIVVSSLPSSNHAILNEWSQYNEGRYIPLYGSKLKGVKSINSFEKTLSDNVMAYDKIINVKGKILLNNTPVSGCYVVQKESLNEVITDSNGDFEITTEVGKTLSVEYRETKSKEIIVLDDSFLKVELESQYEILNEVALSGNVKEKQNLTDKEKRLAQKDRSGIGYQSIDKEDFNPGGFSFLSDLIRGRFLTILVKGEGDQATYHTRKRSSILQGDEILFAVDGVLTQIPPTFLNLNRIENITFKSTLAGTNKYGALGRNGVIEITTMNGEFIDTKESQSALAKNNDYQEGTNTFSSAIKTEVYGNASRDNLKALQQQFLNKIDIDPLDVNNYIAYYKVVEPFDKEAAVRGLTTIIDLADGNTRVLRSLAFFLEEQNLYEHARKIHERILKVAPNESQSYLDLARSYKNEGKYVESFEMLKRILVADATMYIPSPELIITTETELRHLLTKHKDRVNYKEVPTTFYETVQIIDKRILVEWNDPQMEFDLQFVNPAKKFYNWSQNLRATSELDTVTDGLLTKEFIIDDDSNKGEWIINITNNTFKESRVPQFIKMTIQSDFGSKDEKERVLIIPISQLDQKYTIQKISM